MRPLFPLGAEGHTHRSQLWGEKEGLVRGPEHHASPSGGISAFLQSLQTRIQLTGPRGDKTHRCWQKASLPQGLGYYRECCAHPPRGLQDHMQSPVELLGCLGSEMSVSQYHNPQLCSQDHGFLVRWVQALPAQGVLSALRM